MTSVVERNIGKSPRAGVRLLKQVAVCRLRRHLLITLALVASFVLLSVCHVLAESDAVDWRTLIEQYKSREGLTVEERFKLAIAYANIGDIWGAQREFQKLERPGWRDDAAAVLAASEERLLDRPNSVIDLNVVAFASFVLEDYERSCAAFERILEVDPSNEWPRAYLAWTLGRMGRIDEGIEQLERVIKKHPLNLQLRMLLIYAKTQR